MAAADEEVRITLRLPAALRDRLAKESYRSGRSMNAEMVYRLEKTLTGDDKIEELDSGVSELFRLMEFLEQKVREHDEVLFPNRHMDRK